MIGQAARYRLPTAIVVDDFYADPNEVREFALSQEFVAHPEYHRGKRTEEAFMFDGLKERFEDLLGHPILNWGKYRVNGCFQSCVSTDPIVYHADTQTYAGVIFLTPNAPPAGGTKIVRSIHTKERKTYGNDADVVYRHGHYDSTEFETLDQFGNVYNRLILWDAQCIHAASSYFGDNIENGRLFHIFFFDVDLSKGR